MPKNSNYSSLSAIFHLGKFSISTPIAASAFTGYALFANHLSISVILPIAGVFLLASGASALNQVQEKLTDSLMERTRYRPLPIGKLTPVQGFLIALLLIVIGTVLLYYGSRLLSASLGIITVIWYNGIYTPLKKISAFAVFPGSMVGALPPLIGWTAAGGPIADPMILSLSFFFFIVQVPHFWIILLRNASDYEKSGLPVLTKVFNETQIRRLSLTWIVVTALSSILLAFGHVVNNFIAVSLIVILSISLIVLMRKFLFESKTRKDINRAFASLNFYVLSMMIIVILDNLL
jgi:protoheme IX farnesyltransferase